MPRRQGETLINLGRQDIHRVRAADVMRAPTFAEVAPLLLELLDGRVIVAHNAAFDTRFLLAELARAGYPITDPVISLCTMQLAWEFLAVAARRLGVTRATLSRIRYGHSAVTVNMAVRLGLLLGTSVELWLGMQTPYDLCNEKQKSRPEILSLAD